MSEASVEKIASFTAALIIGQQQALENPYVTSTGLFLSPAESGIIVEAADASPKMQLYQEGLKVNRNPTDAQKDAGNYKKGKIFLHGLRITIENPKGSIRRGKSPDGTSWESKLTASYGYIVRAPKGNKSFAPIGKDGDHVDVFIGKHPHAELVYVVDQINPSTNCFDEHKAVLGELSLQSAKDLYLSNYEPGWKGLGDITPLTMQQFKDWLAYGDLKRPVASQVIRAKAASDNGEVYKDVPVLVYTRSCSIQMSFPNKGTPDKNSENKKKVKEFPLEAFREAAKAVEDALKIE